MPSRTQRWVRCVVLACVAAPAARAADVGRVAVVQIDAPGMLPAARAQLEDEVRAGLAAAGLDVQPGATTAGYVEDAVAAGLSCSLVDETCALKVAVAADVASVVVGRVVVVGDARALELRLASLDGTRKSVASRAAPALAARRLVDGKAHKGEALPQPLTLTPPEAVVVVDGAPAALDHGVVWLTPGPHRLVVRAAGHDDHVVDIDVDGGRLPPPLTIALDNGFPVMSAIGLVAAGGGIVIASTGGLLALAAEEVLSTGVNFEEREGIQGLGQFGLAAAGVGGVALIAGGAVAAVGFLE